MPARRNLRAQIALARELCRDHGAQLIVNDYWRLALELGCDFVHLGQEDLAAADLAADPARRPEAGRFHP